MALALFDTDHHPPVPHAQRRISINPQKWKDRDAKLHAQDQSATEAHVAEDEKKPPQVHREDAVDFTNVGRVQVHKHNLGLEEEDGHFGNKRSSKSTTDHTGLAAVEREEHSVWETTHGSYALQQVIRRNSMQIDSTMCGRQSRRTSTAVVVLDSLEEPQLEIVPVATSPTMSTAVGQTGTGWSNVSMGVHSLRTSLLGRMRDLGGLVDAGRALNRAGNSATRGSTGSRWPASAYGGATSETMLALEEAGGDRGDPSIFSTWAGLPKDITRSHRNSVGRPQAKREVSVKQVIRGVKKEDSLKANTEQNYGAVPGDRFATRRNLKHHFMRESDHAKKKGVADVHHHDDEEDSRVKVCPVTQANPALPKEIDLNFTAVNHDYTVKFPNSVFSPPVQMWEPFVLAAVLSLPHLDAPTGKEQEDDVYAHFLETEEKVVDQEGLLIPLTWHERHIEKLMTHTEKTMRRFLPSCVIREHLETPAVAQKNSKFFHLLDDYLRKKFSPYKFGLVSLSEYLHDSLFDPLSSPDQRTPRAFCVSPYMYELLTDVKGSTFEGQYKELLYVMQLVGIPARNYPEVVKQKRASMSKNVWSAAFERDVVPLDFQSVHVYLDTSLISQRYGGHCLKPEPQPISRADQIMIRKVGATLKEIIAGRNILAMVKPRKTGDAHVTHTNPDDLSEHSFRSFFSGHSFAPEGRSRSKRRRSSKSAAGTMDHKDSSKAASEAATAPSPTRLSHSTSQACDPDDAEDSEMASFLAAEMQRKQEEWEAALAGMVDPEDMRFMPLGCSLTEMFVIMHGMVLAMDRRPDADGDGTTDISEGHQRILRTRLSLLGRDRHVLAAAILIDLYMREKIDIWSWQLREGGQGSLDGDKPADDLWQGPCAFIYRIAPMADAPLWPSEVDGKPHWLEAYISECDDIFNKMEIPEKIGDGWIWESLHARYMLRPCGEDINQYRVTANKFLRLLDWVFKFICPAPIYFCGGLLVRCVKRTYLRCKRACYRLWPWKKDEHTLNLKLYEFNTPGQPAWKNGATASWFEELEQRRVAARNRKTIKKKRKRRQKEEESAEQAPAEDEQRDPEAVEAAYQSEAPSHATSATHSQAHSSTNSASTPKDKKAARKRKKKRLMVLQEESEETSAISDEEDDNAGDSRKRWWEQIKAMYADAYFLMFEEDKIFLEEEQEVALFRSQVLMFFFALQSLFEVTSEAHNGLERLMQAISPPFAKLPLNPPKGMEGTGAFVRGICQIARLHGAQNGFTDEQTRQLIMETGEFQEDWREEFMIELFTNHDLDSLLDEDRDGDVTLDQFIFGLQRLPANKVHQGRVPRSVVDGILRDLAMDLFSQFDEDGNGVLTKAEIRRAVAREREAVAKLLDQKKEMAIKNVLENQVMDVLRLVPGSSAFKGQSRERRAEVARIRAEYKNFLMHREMFQDHLEEDYKKITRVLAAAEAGDAEEDAEEV